MKVFKIILILIFCICYFSTTYFCGGGASKFKGKGSSSSSSYERSESSYSESEKSDEDEIMRKINELLKGDFDDESDGGSSGYESDDEYDYKECLEIIVRELSGLGVKERFKKIAQLKRENPQFYKVFTMKKNREYILNKLLSSDPNSKILRIEVCAALGYAKELQEVLNCSKRVAIIIQGRYAVDNKTLLDYANDFGFTEIAEILESYLDACD